jgi:hypothetical protein
MKVTFNLPENRTHTHAGVVYRDGDQAEVTAREREKLAKKGVIRKSRRRKQRKDEDE